LLRSTRWLACAPYPQLSPKLWRILRSGCTPGRLVPSYSHRQSSV
jgi:hypothetical protein